MLLAILFGLQILGNFLMCVESIDNLEEIDVPDNEVEIDKRFTLDINKEEYMKILLRMYNKAEPSSGNVIPDSRCFLPFNIFTGDAWPKLQSHNNYCKDDGGTNDRWCSIVQRYVRGSNNWLYCLFKGAEIADPKKWMPESSCVQLFAYKKKYYKGCTKVDGEKPWCAHHLIFQSKQWSYCIYLEKKWTEWSSWSECSQTYDDEGGMTRTRQCLKTGKLSSGCPTGISLEKKSCNSKSCTSLWTHWGTWSTCSTICSSGTRSRSRDCDINTRRKGKHSEIQTCTFQRDCDEEMSPDPYSAWLSSLYEKDTADKVIWSSCSSTGKTYVTATEHELNPGWEINLKQFYYITKIVVTVRNSHSQRFTYAFAFVTEYELGLDNDLDFSQYCAFFLGPPIPHQKVVFPCSKWGQFVSIVLMKKDYLEMCHVSIYKRI